MVTTTTMPSMPSNRSRDLVPTERAWLGTRVGFSRIQVETSIWYSSFLETLRCADTACLVRGTSTFEYRSPPVRMSKVGPETPCCLKHLGRNELTVLSSPVSNCQAGYRWPNNNAYAATPCYTKINVS